MKYTVTWTIGAERKLARIWLADPDRAAISVAANSIDLDLSRHPLTAGESRSDQTRIHIVDPLGVFYDVHPDDRRVVVWAVWRRSTLN